MKIWKIAQEDVKEPKEPWMASEEDFMDYHKTGHIPSSAYEKYKKPEGLSWLKKANYPVLYATKQFKDKTIEIRQSGEKNKYVKHTEPDADGFTDILRDSQGMAIMMSDEEIEQKGYNLYETSMVAFDGDIAVGLASDEWGADGIWVTQPYQRLGIGLYLLTEFRKQFNSSRKLGQMTQEGQELSKAYYRSLRNDMV